MIKRFVVVFIVTAIMCRHSPLQVVKREIRLAEKEYVRSKILKSNGNTNSIWKILNRCIPRKYTPLATVENLLLLANKCN